MTDSVLTESNPSYGMTSSSQQPSLLSHTLQSRHHEQVQQPTSSQYDPYIDLEQDGGSHGINDPPLQLIERQVSSNAYANTVHPYQTRGRLSYHYHRNDRWQLQSRLPTVVRQNEYLMVIPSQSEGRSSELDTATVQNNEYLTILPSQTAGQVHTDTTGGDGGQSCHITATQDQDRSWCYTAQQDQHQQQLILRRSSNIRSFIRERRKRKNKRMRCIERWVTGIALLSCLASIFVISVILASVLFEGNWFISVTAARPDLMENHHGNNTDQSTAPTNVSSVDNEQSFGNQTTNTDFINCTINGTDTCEVSIRLTRLKQELHDISDSLILIKHSLKMAYIDQHQLTDTIQSRIDSIHGSVNQLRVQATNTCSILSEQQHITEPVLLDDLGDQTCPVNITEGHQLTSTIDIDNECTVRAGIQCQVQPTFSCVTFGAADFLEDDQILVDFICYVVFSNPDITGPVNGTAAIRQESLINTTPNQNIFNDIISDTIHAVGCQCHSFEPSELLSCRYMARYCNYKRGQVTSTIVP